MASQRLTETVLVRRALMELYANLAVLNQDPANAVRFSLEQHASNERLSRTYRNTESALPRSWHRKAHSLMRRGRDWRLRDSTPTTCAGTSPSA